MLLNPPFLEREEAAFVISRQSEASPGLKTSLFSLIDVTLPPLFPASRSRCRPFLLPLLRRSRRRHISPRPLLRPPRRRRSLRRTPQLRLQLPRLVYWARPRPRWGSGRHHRLVVQPGAGEAAEVVTGNCRKVVGSFPLRSGPACEEYGITADPYPTAGAGSAVVLCGWQGRRRQAIARLSTPPSSLVPQIALPPARNFRYNRPASHLVFGARVIDVPCSRGLSMLSGWIHFLDADSFYSCEETYGARNSS